MEWFIVLLVIFFLLKDYFESRNRRKTRESFRGISSDEVRQQTQNIDDKSLLEEFSVKSPSQEVRAESLNTFSVNSSFKTKEEKIQKFNTSLSFSQEGNFSSKVNQEILSKLKGEEDFIKRVRLTDEQRFIFDNLKKGDFGTNTVLVAGSAGTGKSTLLKKFIFHVSKKHNIAVLAPTGIAALTIGGQTIHSFFRFPARILRFRNKQDICVFPKKSKKRSLLNKLDYLIIDEISMTRVDVLDAVDFSLRINRDNPEPFGGVKVILMGDPLQLEPVVKEEEREYISQIWSSPFFFRANVWRKHYLKIFSLKKVIRQRKDKFFIDILNRIRMGITDYAIDELNKHVSIVDEVDNGTVILTPRRVEASEINNFHLSSLKGRSRSYTATIKGKFNVRNSPTSKLIKLKRGAQVMLMANDFDKGYVNGDLGIVEDMAVNKVWVKLQRTNKVVEVFPYKWEQIEYIYDEEEGEIIPQVVGYFRQIPLRLAWAITIHKSQGLTLDKVHVNFGRGIFAHGQSYVALSRCRSLKDLSFDREIMHMDIIIKSEVVDFINFIKDKSFYSSEVV